MTLLVASAGSSSKQSGCIIGNLGDQSGNDVFLMGAGTGKLTCNANTTVHIKAWIANASFVCTPSEAAPDGFCRESSTTASNPGADTSVSSLGYGYASGRADHTATGGSTAGIYDHGLVLRSGSEEDPLPDEEPCDYLPDGEPIYECESPILVPTGNSQAITLTSAEAGVMFDIDGDGAQERVAWTSAGSEVAFLAVDRNGDGFITSGKELFGNNTLPQSANGFDALAEMNMSLNGGVPRGSLTSEDPLFAKLLLWTDVNHNGVSEPGELRPLSDLFSEVGLSYQHHNRRDRHGNEFEFRGWMGARTAPGPNPIGSPAEFKSRQRTVYDVYFRVIR